MSNFRSAVYFQHQCDISFPVRPFLPPSPPSLSLSDICPFCLFWCKAKWIFSKKKKKCYRDFVNSEKFDENTQNRNWFRKPTQYAMAYGEYIESLRLKEYQKCIKNGCLWYFVLTLVASFRNHTKKSISNDGGRYFFFVMWYKRSPYHNIKSMNVFSHEITTWKCEPNKPNVRTNSKLIYISSNSNT